MKSIKELVLYLAEMAEDDFTAFTFLTIFFFIIITAILALIVATKGIGIIILAILALPAFIFKKFNKQIKEWAKKE